MNAPSVPNGVAAHALQIGSILVRRGVLTSEDAGRIVARQEDLGLPFGEAAKHLGLLSEPELFAALATQFEYSYLLRGQSAVSEEVVAAYNPFGRVSESLRALRSQLMLRWFLRDRERTALAVVSAARKDGRSWLAANLAVVCAQLGGRILLIDADLRNPRQHALFGVDGRIGLTSVLSGRCEARQAVVPVEDLPGVSLLCAGAASPNPQELLARAAFDDAIRSFSADYDQIIVDTPATSTGADVYTVGMRAGAALLLTRRHATRTADVRSVASDLDAAGIPVVGTVINDA